MAQEKKKLAEKQISVKIGDIDLDYDGRVRQRMMHSVVKHYSELKDLPDVVVAVNMKKAKDKKPYILADGHHRLEALRRRFIKANEDIEGYQVDNENIVVTLATGIKTYRQLMLYRVEANVKHGLPYSDADRVRSAKLLLGQKYSQKRIAKIFGVDPSTVSKWVKPLQEEKKTAVKARVEALKDEGKSVRVISKTLEQEGIEVSPSTVQRIVKETEDPNTVPERVVEDSTEYDRALDHLKQIQRHFTGYRRQSEKVVFKQKQATRLIMMLEGFEEFIQEAKAKLAPLADSS